MNSSLGLTAVRLARPAFVDRNDGRGLAPGKLGELISWCHGGPVPDF
jgi:hypothetical protein